MKHLVPLVLAVALLVGCDEPRAVVATATATAATASPSATGTATASATGTATASATAIPTSVASPVSAGTAPPLRSALIFAWSSPPKTDIAYLDAIIGAVIAGDAAVLEAYVTGDAAPCARLPEDLPVCPPGTPPGTPVQVVTGGFCPGGGDTATLVPEALFDTGSPRGMTTAAHEAAWLSSAGMRHLVGVYEIAPPARGRYRIAFQRELRDNQGGLYLILSDRGITEMWGASGDPDHACLLPHVRFGEKILIPLPPQSP